MNIYVQFQNDLQALLKISIVSYYKPALIFRYILPVLKIYNSCDVYYRFLVLAVYNIFKYGLSLSLH